MIHKTKLLSSFCFLLCLCFPVFSPVFAETTINNEVEKMFDLSGKRTEFIGITIQNNGITKPEFLTKGQYIPVRELFLPSSIRWDHERKAAIIENDGKQLVISMNDNFIATEDQILWPRGWAILKDGKTMVKFPYLAFIFDRYAKHGDSSEAALWKKKLSFLGISYIDNNDSSAKDKTLHSFINFDE